jgi:hypothetical protein
MGRFPILLLFSALVLWMLVPDGAAVGTAAATGTMGASARVFQVFLPLTTRQLQGVYIVLGQRNAEHGLSLDHSGDVDTEVVNVGSPPTEARRTGNGQILPSIDGNRVADYYMQFRIDDDVLYAGQPTSRVRVEVELFDQGTDTFAIEYDALEGGPLGDGRFKHVYVGAKTNTLRFRTFSITLSDAYFANRDNGADFRLSDNTDGAETVRRVSLILLPGGPQTINVDSCGANPWDTAPDSEAIQTCIDRALSGDTVTFTSGEESAGYHGYVVDKTIFLLSNKAESDLTFTSTDPSNHALLRAHANLRGFVVRLYARSRVASPGDIDDITLSHLSLDGNRAERICYGPDGIDNGVGDNWGSWLPECSMGGDPWCSPGALAMEGLFDPEDVAQDYVGNPWAWTTGLLMDDLHISNTECATAFAMSGAANTIRNCTIDTAGDHVHAAGCTPTENDEGLGDWADGITFTGPGHTVTGNTVYDASDVGIVFFGGKGTVISKNEIYAREGNYGMFSGIAVHPWWYGDVSDVQVVENRVISLGDTKCGGMHTGINIGPHMWGGGCVDFAYSMQVGRPGACIHEPLPPEGALCTYGVRCQVWAHVAQGASFVLQGNYVQGAQVNYLIEGLDVVGTLVGGGNASGAPRMSDWESARNGCPGPSTMDTWGTIDRVAHHPSLAGWTDQRVHCER